MKKVSPIKKRKYEHIRINIEQEVHSSLTTGLEKYRFIHEALPEIDLENIDSSLDIFGKKLSAPILISSMTGGTKEAILINQRLAEAAQETNIGMGVGSQRAALEHSDLIATYKIARDVAPSILLFANIGAIQLNYGYKIEHCQKCVDMIQADGLILHLNSLQEAIQQEGDTSFSNLAKKIEVICKNIEVPVIVKEVGWGISQRTAGILAGCGVSAIDVSGAGGTSWSQVEMYRATNEFSRRLASTFVDWGISTVESIFNVKKAASNMQIFASGGLRNGLDIAKCLALGASLGGMAGPFLKLAASSKENLIDFIRLTIKQIQVSMFGAGASNLIELSKLPMQNSCDND